MELDRKVRWKNLRDELYVKIAGDPHSLDNKDDITTWVNAYIQHKGLYETPKVYKDGYAVNDGDWVKYYYNGRFRCKNKEEVLRYIYGYVCFLIKVGIEDLDEFWYYSICFLIDRLEYRDGLFGCSLENKNRIESTILKALKNRPQEVWTAKKDERKYCLDPSVKKGKTVGEKTHLQKKKDKEITDARIAERYDPSLKSIRKNAAICEVSIGRLHQWLKENGFV